MTERLPITKTYKLAIDGKFPRTESGRTTAVNDAGNKLVAHVCRASRKDVRDAVEAAGKAFGGWSSSTAYLRGQILYRLAEMMEGKRGELANAIGHGGEHEVNAAIDRVVHFAGWTDKFPQVLGNANPVAGPYHNFTIPQPMGVVGVIAPDTPSLLGLVSLVAPVIAAGNCCVVLASETNPIPSMVLAEALATSDLPGGVVNTLTGFRGELVEHFASHRGIIAIHAAGVDDDQRTSLRLGAADNFKRVTIREGVDFSDEAACEGIGWIEPFVEFKTIWHPSAC
ncbi:MAG: aldehyde dehydrogenase family protein [Phycisphaerales bacterium]|nr:aldehyde dehydrogenase family protein [Phycisphaerales bacterium]